MPFVVTEAEDKEKGGYEEASSCRDTLNGPLTAQDFFREHA